MDLAYVQINENLELANKSFIDTLSTAFTTDEVSIINAIKSIKIYNANPSRKYAIRFLCNNDAAYKYNICIADKITGVEQIKFITSVTNPGGLNFLTFTVTLGTNSPVTIKMAIDYAGLSNRVYMNFPYTSSNLIISKQTYTDVKTEDITGFTYSIQANTNSISDIYIKQNAITWSSGYWQSNGVLGSYSSYGHSSYLKVKPGAIISASKLGSVGASASAKVMSFFDANLVWVCYSDATTLTIDANLSPNYYNIAFVSFSTSDYVNLPSAIVISINNNTQLDEINTRVLALENRVLSVENKSMAILGDSIMMLMRTNSVGANTVTYLGTDSNTYTINQLTNIGGRLYVTSTLINGQSGIGTIECEITNSQQSNFDTQNWDALKLKLGLGELINCGLGGATIAERQYITAYPYPDGDGYTTCISNEARMLKRLVTSGRTTPDIIIIWAGTNGAGQPLIDNYSTIMALDWATLSDNVSGSTYRQTFYGGLRFTLEYLYRNFKNSTIYLFSPIQRNYSLTLEGQYDNLTNTRNALLKMGNRYGCVFCDALNESGIVDLYEKQDGSGYWLYDGLHPNAAGKELLKIMQVIKFFLNTFRKNNF